MCLGNLLMNVKFEKTVLVLFSHSVRPHGHNAEQDSTVICCGVRNLCLCTVQAISTSSRSLRCLRTADAAAALVSAPASSPSTQQR